MDTALVKINVARKALAEARDLHSVLEIRDQAAAMHIYAIAQGAGKAANIAKEIQLRAERRAGEFLQGMEKNTGGQAERKAAHSYPYQARLYHRKQDAIKLKGPP